MIVTVVHHQSSYEFPIEDPTITTIADVKELSTSFLHCYLENIRLVYSGVDLANTVHLSDFNRNNITLYAVVIAMECPDPEDCPKNHEPHPENQNYQHNQNLNQQNYQNQQLHPENQNH